MKFQAPIPPARCCLLLLAVVFPLLATGCATMQKISNTAMQVTQIAAPFAEALPAESPIRKYLQKADTYTANAYSATHFTQNYSAALKSQHGENVEARNVSWMDLERLVYETLEIDNPGLSQELKNRYGDVLHNRLVQLDRSFQGVQPADSLAQQVQTVVFSFATEIVVTEARAARTQETEPENEQPAQAPAPAEQPAPQSTPAPANPPAAPTLDAPAPAPAAPTLDSPPS